jgi:hypothetical protein
LLPVWSTSSVIQLVLFPRRCPCLFGAPVFEIRFNWENEGTLPRQRSSRGIGWRDSPTLPIGCAQCISLGGGNHSSLGTIILNFTNQSG